MMLNQELLESFFTELRNKEGLPTISDFIQYSVRRASLKVKEEQKAKRLKSKWQNSLLVDDIIMYLENPKLSMYQHHTS